MFGYNSISEFLLTAIAIIISFTIHEFSHAYVSLLMGDRTAKRFGRLSLNPLDHIDPIGFICLFIFRFGWAKPVPIDPYFYRDRKKGIIFTSLAGPVSNLILAFISNIAYHLFGGLSIGLSYFLLDLTLLNIGLGVFNMIPVPPLDGSKIFAELFGGKVARFIYGLSNYANFILFALLFLTPVENLIGTIIGYVYYFIESITRLIV